MVIMNAIGARYREAEQLLALLGLRRIEDRVRGFIELVAQDYGMPCEDGFRLNLRLTHQDIASALSATSVTVEQVNAAFKAAADGPLQRILGYEERPLVSCDYTNDNRSSIVDALSTMVVDGTLLKVFAWYDNEWGYSCRMADLVGHVVGLEE